MNLKFDQEVKAVLAAQQVSIAVALAIAAASHPNPVSEIDSRLSAVLRAGAATFSDPEELARFRKEVTDIFTRASLHITDDRPSK